MLQWGVDKLLAYPYDGSMKKITTIQQLEELLTTQTDEVKQTGLGFGLFVRWADEPIGSGRSLNHATGSLEKGLSAVAFLPDRHTSIEDGAARWGCVVEYQRLVSGQRCWILRGTARWTGSDGEPLLAHSPKWGDEVEVVAEVSMKVVRAIREARKR